MSQKSRVPRILAALVLASCIWSQIARADNVTLKNGSTDFNRSDAKPDDRGSQIFNTVCMTCHGRGLDGAPRLTVLGLMQPLSIYHALTSGAMRVQGASLSDADKVAVAEFITQKKLQPSSGAGLPPFCTGPQAVFDGTQPPVFPGWGLTAGNTREIADRVAGLTPRDLPRLRLDWAIAFPDAQRVRSHPALAGGALYIGGQDGTVYAFDRRTGCRRWQFQAGGEVRTGIVVSSWKSGGPDAKPALYFGDLVGRVYALDARTGALLWSDRTDPHPSVTLTAAPALYQGRLYVPVSSLEEAIADPHYECCTFRGSVIAYDAATGKRLWQTFMIEPATARGVNEAGAKRFGPSGAAIWNTPAIDAKRHRLYVGTGDNYSSPTNSGSDSIVALDLANGKIVWSHQAETKDAWNVGCVATVRTLCPKEDGPDYDFGASILLAAASSGQDIVVGAQKSGLVTALDAETGKFLWKNKVGRGGIFAGVYFSMAVSGDRLFVPITDASDGRHYDEAAHPGLYALDLKTGDYLWETPDTGDTCHGRAGCMPGIGAAITATPELVLTGGSDGWLRFYSAQTGKVLWRFDTTQKFPALGGGTAIGGSIGGGVAPIAYHGEVIVPSGYNFAGKMPGNALLMFSVH